jgi:membrane protein
MGKVDTLVRTADQFQQQRAWLALPVAVVRKFADNRAWSLAALIAYYAFVAIFPLLLVLVTVLNQLFKNDQGLRHRLVNSALAHYPVIGPQLQDNISPLKQTGVALVVGLAGTLIGARGVARAMQNALNSAWEVPVTRRPRFPWSLLRSLALVTVIGLGLITTSALSGLASGAGQVLTGIGSAVLALGVSLGLNIGTFWVALRLDTVTDIGWRRLLPGAVLGGFAWQVMQAVGGYLVTHQLARSSNLYGTFAVVLGLVGWLYIEAQLTVWAVEANVVLAYHLWPRSLRPPLTPADRRAYVLYADVENRGEHQLIRTTGRFSSAAPDSAAWPAHTDSPAPECG